MLNGTQTLYSKNEDKSIKHHLVIPAVYLDFGPKDKTEELENKVKDEKNGKLSVLKYTVPVTSATVEGKTTEVISAHDPDDLLAEAIGFYSQEFPNENPILKLLHDATSRRECLSQRAKISLLRLWEKTRL